jgi:hypothetical protein
MKNEHLSYFLNQTAMKTEFIILFGIFFCVNSYSQDIINQLKQFHEEADINCYKNKAQNNIKTEYDSLYQWWNITDTTWLPIPKIDLHKERAIPMLAIQFINTEKFDYSDNIYNYITIDSSIVFTFACTDKKMNVYAFVNFFDGKHVYFEVSGRTKEAQRLKMIIKNINKQHPELILFCSALMGFSNNNGFMYIKDGKIFVYNIIDDSIFELNEYIRKFYSLSSIRRFNYVTIPIMYEKDETTRRTGNTSANEVNICLPLLKER